MEEFDEVLYAFSNQDEKDPKICVKDVYGNWIIFFKIEKENVIHHITEHKPVEFKHPLRIKKQETINGDYQFLCEYTLDLVEIVCTIDDKEELKQRIIYEVKTMRMLLNNHWRILDIRNYGIIVFSTELDYTVSYNKKG
ncbi:hypothetical protein ACFL7D_04785 [candidate division KSB1 bacterium]